MTDFTVTLGPQAQLDAEERKARARRAREVLDGAGWVFDERISDLTRDLLDTGPGQAEVRERIFRDIDATAQLKGRLRKILEIQAAEDTANERKQRREQPESDE